MEFKSPSSNNFTVMRVKWITVGNVEDIQVIIGAMMWNHVDCEGRILEGINLHSH